VDLLAMGGAREYPHNLPPYNPCCAQIWNYLSYLIYLSPSIPINDQSKYISTAPYIASESEVCVWRQKLCGVFTVVVGSVKEFSLCLKVLNSSA